MAQNWEKDRGWKNFEAFLGKSLDCFEEMISRNMFVKGNSDEDSNGSQEYDGEKKILANSDIIMNRIWVEI